MKEISPLADNYIRFGIVLTDILERNHITHNQLREAAHYGNNILTDIKAGIPKRRPLQPHPPCRLLPPTPRRSPPPPHRRLPVAPPSPDMTNAIGHLVKMPDGVGFKITCGGCTIALSEPILHPTFQKSCMRFTRFLFFSRILTSIYIAQTLSRHIHRLLRFCFPSIQGNSPDCQRCGWWWTYH